MSDFNDTIKMLRHLQKATYGGSSSLLDQLKAVKLASTTSDSMVDVIKRSRAVSEQLGWPLEKLRTIGLSQLSPAYRLGVAMSDALPNRQYLPVAREAYANYVQQIAGLNRASAFLAGQNGQVASPPVWATLLDASTSSPLSNVLRILRDVQADLGVRRVPAVDWAHAASLASGLTAEDVAIGVDVLAANPMSVPPDNHQAGAHNFLDRRILPQGLSDLFVIIALILTIVVPILQKIDSDAGQQGIEARFAQIDTLQAKQLEVLESLLAQAIEHPQQQFLVMGRSVSLRSRPASGSVVVAKLYPHEIVVAIREKGKWIQVRYLDEKDGEWCYAWALKKYFRRLPHKSGDAERQ